MVRVVARFVVAIVLVSVSASVALAQPLGTFRWNLAPFCNVVSLSVTQIGNVFRLDGFDDQCGATTRAAVVGTAFFNPNGSIGIGLSIVATPGAAPVHVDVTLSLATIGGPWRDSAGNTGTLAFNPPSPTAGAPRPATGGLISTVSPGVGLTGGGITGPVTLSVNFAGTGAAATAARSDHTHAVGNLINVGVGPSALAGITTGSDNVALGRFALTGLTTGQFNTAVGNNALREGALLLGNVAIGTSALRINNSQLNVAVGVQAMEKSTTASQNTALGTLALEELVSGSSNTAIGVSSLDSLTSGGSNTAIGLSAGGNLATGSNNVYIASIGPSAVGNEANHIRIGTPNQHDSTFIAGIRGASIDGATDVSVLIDATGKLGAPVSSRRFKEDIRPLDGASPVLRLEPVSFRYTADQQRGNARQYGLIAEQVAEVMPDLVVRDEDGQPYSVKYQLLPALLLAEIQRLERERAVQAAELRELRERLQAIEKSEVKSQK